MTERHVQELKEEPFFSGACFASAVDGVCKNAVVPADVYREYSQAIWAQFEKKRVNVAEMYEKVLRSVGLTLKDVEMNHARSIDELQRFLRRVNGGERGIVVIDNFRHDVGVVSDGGEKWRLVGDVSNYENRVSLSQLWGLLNKSNPDYFNWMLLPKER